MSADNHGFVSWEEHIVCNERGRRLVHFLLKDASGDTVLVVEGTERSIRHMMYVVSDEFLQAYGSIVSVNASTKWRARRDVVEWLNLIVGNSQMNDSSQGFGSLEASMSGLNSHQIYLPDQMVQRKLKVQNSDIEWSGVAWICAKQLKHYPSFNRNGTAITVHSFVFIMAEEQSHYIGYVEDMYEDKKGLKKVKVRWFHHNQEVMSVIPELDPHPQEILITPHVQVISAECIDGLATVLTPRHYEKCVAAVPNGSPSGTYICFRQFKNNKIKPFTLTKLRGYSNQAIISSLDGPVSSKSKNKRHKLNEEDSEEFKHVDPVRVRAKRSRSCKGQGGLHNSSGVRTYGIGSLIKNCGQTYPKLKLKLSRKIGVKFVVPQPLCSMSFKVDEKVELLCQDSGIRGCWFRCKVLQASRKHLKVQYEDVKDVEGSGNLKEWIRASKVAAPDKFGMRTPGRQTIRPCPPENSMNCTFEVGAPVDAWWSDGWWECVVTRVDVFGDDGVQVYLPGEDKFLIAKKKNLRSSKDWVDNKWVDIKTKTDILCHVSIKTIPHMKITRCSDTGEVFRPLTGSPMSLAHKVPVTPRLEAVVGEEKLPILSASDNLISIKDVNLKDQSHVNNANVTESGGGGSGCGGDGSGCGGDGSGCGGDGDAHEEQKEKDVDENDDAKSMGDGA